MSFYSDTEVRDVEGTLVAEIGRAWEAAPGTPNGGYLAGIALRAAGLRRGDLRPASVHCAFLKRAAYGRAQVSVRELRQSEQSACLSISLEQAQSTILQATVWLTHPLTPGYDFQDSGFPDAPAPDGCRDVLAGVPAAPCWRDVEFLSPMPDPSSVGPKDPFFRAWHRFRNEPLEQGDAFLSAARLLFLADVRAFGPVLCQRGCSFLELPHLALTLDIYAQFHEQLAADQWLLMDATVEAARAGCVGSHVQAWSGSGRRLASCTVNNVCKPNPLLARR